MNTVKEAVIRLVQSLPDHCTIEDIHYHLYIRAKVDSGLRAIEEGEVVSEEEADRRIEEWVSSSGPS